MDDIKLGRKIITNVFGGNPYSQLALMRKTLWAIAVLSDVIEGDKIKAQTVIDFAQLKDSEIDKHITKEE